ncbi:MAG: hypothetical protein J2P59_09785, partial [Acidimicrobiales bacterium]|nr:hypothetical protein [Acidimicrobiales bacterium]
LMHSRDYSEDTARVVDEEVERILRQQEERALEYLTANKAGLDAVASSLLEKETLDSEEVARLVDEAAGRHVGGGNGSQPLRLLHRNAGDGRAAGDGAGDTVPAGLPEGSPADASGVRPASGSASSAADGTPNGTPTGT